MKNWQIRILGTLAFIVLVVTTASFCSPQIQDELTEKTTRALQEQDLNWAHAKSNGLDLYLSGQAPTHEKREQAEKIARELWGPKTVTNNITVAEAISPYYLTAAYDGHSLNISGYAPTEESISNIIQAATEITGEENLSHNIKLANGAPAYWEQANISLMRQITHLKVGSFELRDTHGTLNGEALNITNKQSIEDELSLLENYQYSSSSSLTAPPPPPTCQEKFNNALYAEQIIFENGKANISLDSHPLLLSLKQISQDCPDAIVTIIGHSDSNGTEEANAILSGERAQAVLEHLQFIGADVSQFNAIGKGEEQPIANNNTKEGRAKNRRIEFFINVSEPN